MTLARVLLVEDEDLIRLIIAEALEEEGFEVVEAADANSASAMIDGPDGFDLLLTDIQMPGDLDGIGLADRARARHPRLPVIFVTGRPEVMNRMGRLGPLDVFIRKPYGPAQVVAAARRLLGAPA